MNKKILIPVFIFLIAGIALLIKLNIKEPVKQNLSTQVSPANIVPPEKLPSNILKEYSDPSGFTFSYPEDIEIKSQETDNSTYSDLILTSKIATGSINLKVSDTKYKSVESWKKENKDQIAQAEIQNANLGDLSGISFIDKNKLAHLVFDQGIEFKIEVDYQNEKSYWENVYSNLISNFSFTSQNTSTTNTDTASESDVIFEGEEVIE